MMQQKKAAADAITSGGARTRRFTRRGQPLYTTSGSSPSSGWSIIIDTLAELGRAELERRTRADHGNAGQPSADLFRARKGGHHVP